MKKYSIDVKTVIEQYNTLKELRCGVSDPFDCMDDGARAVEVATGLEVMLSNMIDGLSSDGQVVLTRSDGDKISEPLPGGEYVFMREKPKEEA